MPGNTLAVRTKSLNNEGVRRTYEMMLKAETELQAIFADPILEGEHKFGSAPLAIL